jgi:hypothetical protein
MVYLAGGRAGRQGDGPDGVAYKNTVYYSLSRKLHRLGYS